MVPTSNPIGHEKRSQPMQNVFIISLNIHDIGSLAFNHAKIYQ
jgi:hypothetical protein